MERIKHYTLGLLVALTGVILVLSLTAAIVINSGVLDLVVKNRVISLFNESYRGRLELKEVHLNFPNKVLIDEPAVFEEGNALPALSAKSVTLKFNFLSLLKPKIKTLHFRAFDADGFNARITENEKGRLNLQDIFAPRDSLKQTMAIENFRCNRIHLKESSIFFANRGASGKRFSLPENLDVRGINIDLSRLSIQKEKFSGIINNVQFQVPSEGFALRKGSFSFTLSKERSELLNVVAETAKSSAKLSVSLDGLSVFSPELQRQLPKSHAFVHVESLNLHTADLNIFFPKIGLPDGLYTLSGDAKGTLGELQIQKLLLGHETSKLALKGKLLNLQAREKLAFQLQIDSSMVSSALLQKLLKEENQKYLAKQTGDIRFSGLLKGSLSDWTSDMAFQTAIGRGTLAVDVKREGEALYRSSGKFVIADAELHRLIHLESAKSKLNCSGNIALLTKKFTPEQLHLDAALTNSLWQQQTVATGRVVADYDGHLWTASADLQQGDGAAAQITAKIDMTAPLLPLYEAKGTLSRVDISKSLASQEFRTNLNGTFELNGRGFDPASLNVAVAMHFAPSSINEFQLKDNSKISAEIAQSAATSSITLKSDFADATIEGNYSFREFLNAVNFASASIQREISQQDIWHGGFAVASAGGFTRPFTVNYKINIRDSNPFVIMLPVKDIELQATASGKVSCNGNQLQLNSDIAVSEFHASKTLTLNNSKFIASVQCTPAGVPAASVSGTTASGAFQGKELRNLIFKAGYGKGKLDVSMDVALPRLDEKISFDADALHNGQLYTVNLAKLSLTSSDGVWQVPPGSQFDVAKTFTRFRNLRIQKANQQIAFDGMLSSTQPGIFQCTLTNIDLAEVRRLALDPSHLLTGRANAQVTVSGTPGAKTSALDLKGDNVVFNDIVFGTVHLTAQHSRENLKFDYNSQISPASQPQAGGRSMNTIKGGGNLPLILSYSPFQLSIPENRSLQASLHSDNLSARFLEYVLPFFESAEGIIPFNLRVGGTTSKPDLFLSARMDDTKITIEPTQVSYRVTGDIEATPARLELRNLMVRDSLQGTGSLTGMVKLSGLEAKSIDLEGKCRNLLLFNKKDKKDEKTFGTMTGTTNNFRFYGDLKSPTAEGDVRVSDANFTLYRIGSNESAKYIGVEKFIEFVPRYPQRVAVTKSEKRQDINPPEFYYNLIDILQINNLKLTGTAPLHYNVIFDRVRGEKLETTISNLSLNVNKQQQRYRLFGSVDITSGKYKFSNSNFDLQNGGRIVWNNQEIRDGVMENLFGSKQVAVSDAQTGERDNVKLLLAIGGTLNEPNVKMGYYLNDSMQPYSTSNMMGKQSSLIDPNAELNVISILLSKQWYVHPDRQGKTNIPVSSVGLSAGTGMISSQISNVIQNLAGLESFNVNMGMDGNGALSGLELYVAMAVPGTDGKIRFIGTGSSPNLKNNVQSNYYGTSQKVEYRVTSKLYMEAYRSYGILGNEASNTNLQKPSETWGVSMSYREKFYNWNQFWNRIIRSSDKKENSDKKE